MGRAPCCDKEGLKKGPWLPEEDQKLVDYIQKNGPGNWRTLPKKAGLQRCGKSCRLRWTNYLRPDIKRGRFSFEEEEAIIQLHRILGNKWSAIAAKLPGRTDNEIKNYWNTHIRKRMLRMGLDPVTHTRRLDFLDLPSIFNSPLQNSNSQLKLLKLLSLQTLVNPDLLKLASFLSTNQNGNLNLLTQNHQPNQLASNNSQNESHFLQKWEDPDISVLPMQMSVLTYPEENPFQNVNLQSHNPLNLPSCSAMTNTTTAATTTTTVPVLGDSPLALPDLVQYPNEISGFDGQNQARPKGTGPGQNQWQNQIPFLSDEDQALMSAFFDTSSGFQTSHNNNQSLSSSQKTPLSSNSTVYPNSSSEDEIDSYCRNLLDLDIPLEMFDL